MATYKLPEGQKLATFKIEEESWEAFKALCEASGTSASRTLITFIEQSLSAGKIDESLLPKPKGSLASYEEWHDRFEARLAEMQAKLDAKLEAVLEKKF